MSFTTNFMSFSHTFGGIIIIIMLIFLPFVFSGFIAEISKNALDYVYKHRTFFLIVKLFCAFFYTFFYTRKKPLQVALFQGLQRFYKSHFENIFIFFENFFRKKQKNAVNDRIEL